MQKPKNNKQSIYSCLCYDHGIHFGESFQGFTQVVTYQIVNTQVVTCYILSRSKKESSQTKNIKIMICIIYASFD